MTGFEKYLEEERGYTLTAGKRGDLSTFTNLGRVWVKDGHKIHIGLYAIPTRIGITHPVRKDGSSIDYVPSKDEYEEIVNEIEMK